MKYTGNLCQGCGQPFSDDDDVVVCPECGTPQHRECYDKENRCVCAHLHGEEYTWQGKVNNESPLPTEKAETVSCPNCGYENPKGTPVCKQCGMKFTIFGMNVVDAMHEEEKRASNPNRDIPAYKAPFSLGEGEGFEVKNDEAGNPSAPELEELITKALTGNIQESSENGVRLNLGGPFPENDEIDGVMTNNIGNFIGTNAMTYISKFKKMQRGKALSFNFAAFFLAPYWFFFRKLYKAGILFMTLHLAASIVVTPYLYSMLELYEGFAVAVQSGTMTDAQLMEIYNQFTSSSTPMLIYCGVVVLIQLICGFIANPLYKKYVVENVKVVEKLPSKRLGMAYAVKHGGASVLLAAAAYFAYQLLSIIVSSMM